MRLPARHTSAVGKINVTPLIDVVMCLIIFYLLVFRLAVQRQANVDLPATGVGITAEVSSAIVIVVTGSPTRILVEGQEVAPQDLARVLQARGAGRDQPVQIRADRTLPYAAIAPVVEACRAAGVAGVDLITERAEGGR